MKLPHLSRRVELDSGMAVLLYTALNTVYQELLYYPRSSEPETVGQAHPAPTRFGLDGIAAPFTRET
jgi:hypothetical protein